MRDKLIIVFAILVMVISTWGRYEWDLQHRKQIPVLVAKQHIDQYTVISQDMLGTKIMPEESLDPAAYQNPNDVIGKMNVVELWPEEQLKKEKFDAAEIKLRPGEVELTVETDLIKADGGELNPGDYAMLSVRYKPESGRRDTETILKKVHIVAIKDATGNTTNAKSTVTSTNFVQSNVVNQVPKAVVMKVYESDANRVITATGLGDMVFAKLP